jgi:ribosomal protein L37AE/L43A
MPKQKYVCKTCSKAVTFVKAAADIFAVRPCKNCLKKAKDAAEAKGYFAAEKKFETRIKQGLVQ